MDISTIFYSYFFLLFSSCEWYGAPMHAHVCLSTLRQQRESIYMNCKTP